MFLWLSFNTDFSIPSLTWTPAMSNLCSFPIKVGLIGSQLYMKSQLYYEEADIKLFLGVFFRTQWQTSKKLPQIFQVRVNIFPFFPGWRQVQTVSIANTRLSLVRFKPGPIMSEARNSRSYEIRQQCNLTRSVTFKVAFLGLQRKKNFSFYKMTRRFRDD